MAYVIRAEDGQYVTPADSDRAYSHGLAKARIFASRADAEREARHGEIVMNVDAMLPLLAREGAR